MKITEVEYSQVKSIGEDDSCRASVKVILEDGESPEKAFEVAKACVRRQLGTQEKQKEEDKEKNRQREAMKGSMNSFGQIADPYEFVATKIQAPVSRHRPTQEVDVTNQATTGWAATRAATNVSR